MYFVSQRRSVVGVLESPFLSLLDGRLLVSLPGISNFLIQRIIQVGQRHQGLDWEQNRSDLESRRPLVLQDVETDSAKLVDVGVVDLGSEQNLWWDHGVLIWQEKLTVEDATFVWSLAWTSDLHVEVSGIGFVWLSINTHNWVLSKSLGFLVKWWDQLESESINVTNFENSWGNCHFVANLNVYINLICS